MVKKLFLLDGMALVYRAHFALIAKPIFTSKGINTSALYGFTQTLLEILRNQQPTHIGVAFDTAAPTQRHVDYAGYKATRQEMPEDISRALPEVMRMLEAFQIPVITCDGYEADDLIGTLVCRAQKEGYVSYMVTPDKDFGQLVGENTFLYKPSRMGDAVEVMGVPEICARWAIRDPAQVVDVLALMGDASDNIPGVPGIGEKTAIKLIGQFGTVENLLAKIEEVTGKLKDKIQAHREEAILSKRLATIICDAPCPWELESLKLRPPKEDDLKSLLIEFEFNTIGRRLFGDDFKAGRGSGSEAAASTHAAKGRIEAAAEDTHQQGIQVGKPAQAHLRKLADVPHEYAQVREAAQRRALADSLQKAGTFALKVDASSDDPKVASIRGMAFAYSPHRAFYVPLPARREDLPSALGELRALLESEAVEKAGHNLKHDLAVLKWHGLEVNGKLFDTMVAHSLLEPDQRHSFEYLAEACLGYTPIGAAGASGEMAQGELLPDAKTEAERAGAPLEWADVTLQLRAELEPLLKRQGQERVFYEIEMPLTRALVDMEFEGIKVDAAGLAQFSEQLAREMEEHEKAICQMAGSVFNLNSPKQLGQVLFDVMKICEAPKKTRTGQYVTDEQTLATLAADHEIVRKLLEYRTVSKLKSTYADALPAAIWPRTGRVHTTYNQVMTSTGRLNSQNPNLQNIPIRTERGQEIRKAFVPRNGDYLLLSADYSQIELRIIAALSREAGLLEAFRTGADVHTATAARVFGVFPDMVTPEMRRKAKMVNYGIAYGISAFGLAQRLGIPRREASEIIDQYFKQFSGIRKFMDDTIAFARKHGYVETVTGRRRYIRDINSSNNTVRGGAERNAINAPVQGTAADMIKVAMVRIHSDFCSRRLKSRMLLQVHDELVFEVDRSEEPLVRDLVKERMVNALALDVPIVVETGVGQNWLEAH